MPQEQDFVKNIIDEAAELHLIKTEHIRKHTEFGTKFAEFWKPIYEGLKDKPNKHKIMFVYPRLENAVILDVIFQENMIVCGIEVTSPNFGSVVHKIEIPFIFLDMGTEEIIEYIVEYF